MLKRWSLFKCCFSTKEVKQEERPSRPKTSDLDLKVWAPTGIENQNAIIPGKVMIDPDVESLGSQSSSSKASSIAEIEGIRSRLKALPHLVTDSMRVEGGSRVQSVIRDALNNPPELVRKSSLEHVEEVSDDEDQHPHVCHVNVISASSVEDNDPVESSGPLDPNRYSLSAPDDVFMDLPSVKEVNEDDDHE